MLSFRICLHLYHIRFRRMCVLFLARFLFSHFLALRAYVHSQCVTFCQCVSWSICLCFCHIFFFCSSERLISVTGNIWKIFSFLLTLWMSSYWAPYFIFPQIRFWNCSNTKPWNNTAHYSDVKPLSIMPIMLDIREVCTV